MHSLRRALHLPVTASGLRRLSSTRRAPAKPPSAATGDDEWNDAWETAWLPGDSPTTSPAPAAPWESPASPAGASVPAIAAEVDPDTKAFVADMDERWAERRAASQRGPPQRAAERGAVAGKKARADEYRTRKQRVHAALWVKEIEKMEEARLGGGGGGADDIDRLLDSCSDIFDSGNTDFGNSKIPSTTEIKTKPDGWETTLRGMSNRFNVQSEDREHVGPLHDAARNGEMDTCKHLVEHLGFHVNSVATDGSGLTPLACAVSHGKAIAARYFLDKGADINKQDCTGFAPLHYAAKKGNEGMTHLLVSRGAGVDMLSSEGTPLHVAASYGNYCVLQTLLEHPGDPNMVSADLCTPVTAVLCAVEDGKTPIEIAAKDGRRTLMEILFTLTSLIQAVADWSVEGIVIHTKSRPSTDNDTTNSKGQKDQLKLLGRETVAKMDDAGASKFYTRTKVGFVQRKSYANSKMGFLFWLCIWLLCIGKAAGSTKRCDSNDFASRILGSCIAYTPNAICCPTVTTVIEMGIKHICFCEVIKEEVMVKQKFDAEKFLKYYHICKGKLLDADKLINNCTGTSPAPSTDEDPNAMTKGKVKNNSKHLGQWIVVVVVLSVIFALGFGSWLIYQWLKHRALLSSTPQDGARVAAEDTELQLLVHKISEEEQSEEEQGEEEHCGAKRKSVSTARASKRMKLLPKDSEKTTDIHAALSYKRLAMEGDLAVCPV